MKLKIETIGTATCEFAEAFGAPAHITSPEKMERLVFLYHRELSKIYTEEKFPAALSIAWSQARRFPVLADFNRGYDAPRSIKEDEPDFTGYYKPC